LVGVRFETLHCERKGIAQEWIAPFVRRAVWLVLRAFACLDKSMVSAVFFTANGHVIITMPVGAIFRNCLCRAAKPRHEKQKEGKQRRGYVSEVFHAAKLS